MGKVKGIRSITKRIALFCVCSCVKVLLVIANMIVHKQDLRETIIIVELDLSSMT